jgi:hypothetical protein
MAGMHNTSVATRTGADARRSALVVGTGWALQLELVAGASGGPQVMGAVGGP